MTPEPAVLRGALRDYDWGVVDGMREWGAAADGAPHAELWFGCHPAAPSPLREHPGRTLVDEWGGGKTPLLTKILAAATPLSLQVHPTAAVIAGWRDDPAAGRLLQDPVEKTEMLIAVQPFTCLVDWRPAAAAHRVLAATGADAQVLDVLAAGDMPGAARLLIGPHPVVRTGPQWSAAFRAAESSEVAVAAMDRVTARFGTDPGVAVAALLQPLLLQPGDAVYVPAGVPHAYVHGLGVEVMTSSDNVLRLGLTSKTVAVPYALAALEPARSAVVARSPASGRYSFAGAPFSVTVAATDGVESPSGRYRLVLALEGRSSVVTNSRRYDLSPGDALAIPAASGVATVSVAGQAVVVRAAR